MMQSSPARNNRAPRQFKKGINAEEARRKREEFAVELRRSKREENVQKRRQGAGGAVLAADEAEVAAQPHDEETQARLMALPQYVQMLMSADPAVRLDGTIEFRKILSIKRNPPIDGAPTARLSRHRLFRFVCLHTWQSAQHF
jgi:importin subunit alpha-1